MAMAVVHPSGLATPAAGHCRIRVGHPAETCAESGCLRCTARACWRERESGHFKDVADRKMARRDR